MTASLKEIQALVETLPASDQLRLLQFLVPRLADAALAADAKQGVAGTSDAWQAFRKVGEQLAATSNGESITRAVSDMRR